MVESFGDGRSILQLLTAACPSQEPREPYPPGCMVWFSIAAVLEVSMECRAMTPIGEHLAASAAISLRGPPEARPTYL